MSGSTSMATLEVVLLDVGAYRIACPSDQVVTLLAAPQKDAWICLETLLGLELEQSTHRRHYLQVHCKQDAAIIALPSPPRIVSLEADCIHPLPLLLRRHGRLPGLVALGYLPDAANPNSHHCVLLLDFRRL